MRMPPVVASRLRAADARHFVGNDAYNRVARATCRADAAIARKELPECWAMAERIHDEFWRSASEPPRRVVDVAAGHGLLGMFLLALCCKARTPLPVVYAVDERMPSSAGKLRDSFGAAFPRLRRFPVSQKSFTYRRLRKPALAAKNAGENGVHARRPRHVDL